MTPPDDRSPYGMTYGSGHDAFGSPGQQYDQQYGQEYDQQYAGGWQLPEQPPQYAPRRSTQPSGGYQEYAEPEGFSERAEPPGWIDEEPEESDAGPLVRPFAMTGGRTRPRYELALEALVSASVDPARLATLLPEHQRICTLCTEVKSIAEVSALLSIPLGVARILVADLAEAGLVTIHQPAAGGESGNQPDVTLLERVLSGLRKL